jgi:hypothetical protein
VLELFLVDSEPAVQDHQVIRIGADGHDRQPAHAQGLEKSIHGRDGNGPVCQLIAIIASLDSDGF